MPILKIDIPKNRFVAVLGGTVEGKATKIIIGDTVDEVFRETREKDLVSRILYEDKVFKSYGSEEDDKKQCIVQGR